MPVVDLRKAMLGLAVDLVLSMVRPVNESPSASNLLYVKLMYSPMAERIDRNVTRLDDKYC